MTFQKLPTQALADHPVVLVEDVPRTVTKVREPTHRHAIDFGNRRFQGLARLSGCQPANRINHLAMAFRSWKTKFATKRITKEFETLRSAVNNVSLLGVQRQTSLCDEAFDFLKCQLRVFLRTTQDHKSSAYRTIS